MNRALIATACSLIFLPAAHAENLDSFVDPVDRASSHWARSYSAEHLADHPDQLVTKMELDIIYRVYDKRQPGQVNFALGVEMRGGQDMITHGICSPEGDNMLCMVECDGGGVLVSHRDDGSVLVDLEHTGYIRMSETGCGSGGNAPKFQLQPGMDDKQFLLHPN